MLFTALIAGHLGYAIPQGIGTLGLVLFVYCVGIGAGGRFCIRHAGWCDTSSLPASVATEPASLGLELGGLNCPLIGGGNFAGALTSTLPWLLQQKVSQPQHPA